VKRRIGIALSILSVAGICFFTLGEGGTEMTRGWSYALTSGDAALAELLANIILFIPFGAAFTAAFPRRPYAAVVIGAALSFAVEFAQQSIPGRDPSVGDIVCNTVGTALGVLLVVAAPIWLWAPPRRSVWQARLTALIAVLVWYGTGVMLRQDFPPGPYRIVQNPSLPRFGYWEAQILKVTTGVRSLEVVATTPSYLPGRTTPLIAVLTPADEHVLLLSVDGPDLTLRYDMPALRWLLQQPDLRLRGAMRPLAPHDTFTAATSHDLTNICLRVDTTTRCNLGYTIGDGWKLIYYPEGRPLWQLELINTLWMVGCVIGIGFWAARGTGGKGGWLALGFVIAGLLVVPLLTGLKPTPIYEWIGAIGGMALGYWLASRNSPIELR
jgi:hypothetical protein